MVDREFLLARAEFGHEVLHSRLHDHPHLRGGGDHALEEGAWAGRPRLVVQSEHIAEHHAAIGGVWQDHKGTEIRHQAKLPDWSHALDRGQCVYARKRLHGKRLADALRHTTRQAIDVRGLATDDATVVTVHEANQAYVCLCRTLENGL